MKTISLPRSIVIKAAKSRGVSACEEVDRLLSAFLGRKVCSHLLGGTSRSNKIVFSFTDGCVHTRRKEK